MNIYDGIFFPFCFLIAPNAYLGTILLHSCEYPYGGSCYFLFWRPGDGEIFSIFSHSLSNMKLSHSYSYAMKWTDCKFSTFYGMVLIYAWDSSMGFFFSYFIVLYCNIKKMAIVNYISIFSYNVCLHLISYFM